MTRRTVHTLTLWLLAVSIVLGLFGPRRLEAQPLVDAVGDPLPPGAIARLGTYRWRHESLVNAVAYSADGKRLFSAGDSTVRVWDVDSGKELKRYGGKPIMLRSMALSHDDKFVAGGTAKRVILWDAASTGEMWRSEPLEHEVAGVAFSPDGKSLAAISRNVLRTWDVTGGKEALRISGPPGFLCGLAYSPDGKFLLAGCEDGTARAWDAANGQERRVFEGHKAPLQDLAISHDGARLTTASTGEDSSIRIWDMAKGNELLQFKVPLAWRRQLAFSPDGKTLAASGRDGLVRLWDLKTAEARQPLEVPARHANEGALLLSITISPDGRTLAAGCDCAILRWDVSTGRILTSPPGHRSLIRALVVPSTKELVSASADGTVCFWEPATGRQLRAPLTYSRSCYALAFARAGQQLLWTEDGEKLRLWDLKEGKEIRSWPAPDHLGIRFALSDDGRLAASASPTDGLLKLWETATGRVIHELTLPGRGADIWGPLLFAPDGRWLAGSSNDAVNGTIVVWDTALGKEVSQTKVDQSPPVSLAFLPDSSILAVPATERIVLIQPATGRTIGELHGSLSEKDRLAFSPDGRMLAAGDSAEENPTLRFWELATGTMFASVTGHRRPISGVAFAPDGRSVVTASADTTLLVWDVTTLGSEGRPQRGDVAALWSDLAGKDVAAARRAVWALADAADQSVPFLAQKLKPVALADRKETDPLVARLDSNQFAEREDAARRLEELGEGVVPALRAVLEGSLSAEARRRVERLMEKLTRADGTPELLRGVRAVEVLERVATPEARRLLVDLAAGLPDARLTREARAAIDRLTR